MPYALCPRQDRTWQSLAAPEHGSELKQSPGGRWQRESLGRVFLRDWGKEEASGRARGTQKDCSAVVSRREGTQGAHRPFLLDKQEAGASSCLGATGEGVHT